MPVGTLAVDAVTTTDDTTRDDVVATLGEMLEDVTTVIESQPPASEPDP